MPTAQPRTLSTGKLLLIAFATAFVFVTLLSNCSFLYPTNPWSDANCFYTVGRCLNDGRVLYRDVYEQKGPWLYFLHACVEWIPGQNVNPFLEIYFIEVLAATATLFFLARTILLFRPRRALAFLPLLAAVIYTCRSYSYGDSVEEFSLVMASYVQYVTLRMLRSEEHDMSCASLFFVGVCCGVVFWMKYNTLGFAIGAMILPLSCVVRERNWKLLGRAAAFVLLGVAVATLPVAIYFGVHGAFDALWEAYFYNNIFLYPEEKTLFEYVRFIFGRTFYLVRSNIAVILFIVVGWVHLVRRKMRVEALHVFLCMLLVELSSVMGARFYIYYALMFAPAAVFGVVALDAWIERVRGKWAARVRGALAAALCLALLLPSVLLGGIDAERESLFTYRLAKIINQTPDATMIDLGGLDSGLYTATGILPVSRFFCRLNLWLPEARMEWYNIIATGAVDYVYMGRFTLEEYHGADAPYELVAVDEGNHLYRRVQ